HSLVHHAGGVIGGSAQMMALPELGLDVMLIANRAAIDVPQLAKDVLAACVANADPVIAIDVPTPANGIFRSPSSGMVIELGTLDGRQTLSLMGAAAPVRFRSDGTIALEVDLGVAIRVPTGETEPSSIDYLGLGGRETLERIVPPSRIDRSLLGNYVSREAEAEARVIEAGELLRLETRSRYGAMTYRVQPIGPGLWSAAPAGAPVPFGAIIERDAEGFRFSTRRARRVRFERRD
ncbi:MAG: hypothetical protein ACREXP_11190, partial [Steroidobacteraceae bacterium]